MGADVLACFHIREELLCNLHKASGVELPGAVDNQFPEPVALSFQDSFEPLPLSPGGILRKGIPGERVVPGLPDAKQTEGNTTAGDFGVLFNMKRLPRNPQAHLL